MNGSHWEWAVPSKLKYAVATARSHPVLVGLRYRVSKDGKRLISVLDITGDKSYDSVRFKALKFNRDFNKAQLGQFEPHGTNARTVEGSYELAKILRELNQSNSPFLVHNKKEQIKTPRTWPEPTANALDELYEVALTGNGVSELRSIEVSPLKAEAVSELKIVLTALSDVFEKTDAASRIAAATRNVNKNAPGVVQGTVIDPTILFESFGQHGKDGNLFVALAIRQVYPNEPIAIPLPVPAEGDVEGLANYRANWRMLNEVNEFLAAEGKQPFAMTASVSRAVEALKKLGANQIGAIVGTGSGFADEIKKQIPDAQIQFMTHQRFNSLFSLTPYFAEFQAQIAGFYARARSA